MATRRTNKRKRRNRGRFGFLYKFVSFLLIVVVVVAGCVVFFRVEEVAVAGQSQYSAGEIVAASGIGTGDNLFALNKYQAARNIYTALPYVDGVSIRRTLPNGLLITVTECVPALLIQGPTSWWVVDGKGKILEEVKTEERAGTARVDGLTALLPAAGTTLVVDTLEQSKLETLLQLVTALEGRGMMDRVSQFDLTGNARLTMTYDGRFTVVLPMSGDFDRAARALLVIVEENLQPNDTGKIDMSSVGQPKEEFTFSPN